MLISFVIPAYNAGTSICRALDSIYSVELPGEWRTEAVVVDDGSDDGVELEAVVANYPDARLVKHLTNRGMCAGRNSGILASVGDVVVILDADDQLVPGWPTTFQRILDEWPEDVHLCYAACINPRGEITAAEPHFRGYLNLQDILNERHSGEYIPLFRGNYVRGKPYIDLGMRKSCGILSYINFAHDAPFWVSPMVLRIYNDASIGSVTYGWTSPSKARETAKCYQVLFERYGELYRSYAPGVYHSKLLRLAVYLRMAGLPGAWKAWWKGASVTALWEAIGAAFVLMLGAGIGASIVVAVKKFGLVRRYG